jgi:monovalent cation/hydrogen antiporter
VYAITVGATIGGQYSPLDVTGLVVLSYVGGIAAGVLVAGAAYAVMRPLRDTMTINIALLLTPFSAYLLAELVGASGVLAVVVAGLAIAYLSARISTAGSRRQTESVWPLGSYVLNGALFMLIGFQVQAVAHELDFGDVGRLLVIVVAVWLGLVVVRFVFQTAAVLVIRLLDRRPSQRADG